VKSPAHKLVLSWEFQSHSQASFFLMKKLRTVLIAYSVEIHQLDWQHQRVERKIGRSAGTSP